MPINKVKVEKRIELWRGKLAEADNIPKSSAAKNVIMILEKIRDGTWGSKADIITNIDVYNKEVKNSEAGFEKRKAEAIIAGNKGYSLEDDSSLAYTNRKEELEWVLENAVE